MPLLSFGTPIAFGKSRITVQDKGVFNQCRLEGAFVFFREGGAADHGKQREAKIAYEVLRMAVQEVCRESFQEG